MIRLNNIYHMLAYAFRVLQEKGYQEIAKEDFAHEADLLAAILTRGLVMQIKRGLTKEYELREDLLRSPRGKIEISASIKENSFRLRQLVCNYDEFTENAYMNRILKTAAMLLIRSCQRFFAHLGLAAAGRQPADLILPKSRARKWFQTSFTASCSNLTFCISI